MTCDPVLLERARKLQAFFSQPFFVADPFTKRPGSQVSRAEALRGYREILDGRQDDLPVGAFLFHRQHRRDPRRGSIFVERAKRSVPAPCGE